MLPQFQNGQKIDFKGMQAAFNIAFSAQVMPGEPGEPLAKFEAAKMIFSKSAKQLKAHYKQLDKATRVR